MSARLLRLSPNWAMPVDILVTRIRASFYRSDRKGEHMRRVLLAGILAVASLSIAAPAAAHSQTVTPPGQDAVVSGPIAVPWVQGHCRAQAPAVSGEASGGVVIFSPQQALPCSDTITNPGGQVTGP
jgi:hypothetical protein